jgi:hypothetical protein
MLILCLAVAAPTVKAQETGSDTPQDLLERIDTLEKRLRKMEDEARRARTWR